VTLWLPGGQIVATARHACQKVKQASPFSSMIYECFLRSTIRVGRLIFSTMPALSHVLCGWLEANVIGKSQVARRPKSMRWIKRPGNAGTVSEKQNDPQQNQQTDEWDEPPTFLPAAEFQKLFK
jgi:hypothetical protein